jgi:hypothetical protein
MKKLLITILALALSAPTFSAEVVFAPAEIAAMQGDTGPQGPIGPRGADGTSITELAGMCSTDIGGQVFAWPCSAAGSIPDPHPTPDPHHPHPAPVPHPTPQPDPDPHPIHDPVPDPTPTPDPVPSRAWIGVPMPTFGVTESVSDVDYTHWIDNSVACSDSGNGSPDTPRCTVPAAFAAASIVQLRGGPYPQMAVTFNGTPSSPVFFRGATGNQVVFQGLKTGLAVSGQYFIVENVDVNRLRLETPGFGAFRDSYIHDADTGAMIWIQGNNLVFLRNEVARNGSIPSRKDNHAFNIGGNAFNLWILENLIHSNSGDSIQFCHGCVRARNGGPGAIYIANNVMHSDEENAMDFKEFTGPVIVSGNELYNYYRLQFSGNGDAIRVNDEGKQGELWMIRNNIHDSNICINVKRSRAKSFAVDNICTDTNAGFIGGFSGKAGNLVDGVSDGNPEALYQLFERRYGLSIRP